MSEKLRIFVVMVDPENGTYVAHTPNKIGGFYVGESREAAIAGLIEKVFTSEISVENIPHRREEKS